MARLLNIKIRKPAEFEKRSRNVITLNITQGEAWTEICAFLATTFINFGLKINSLSLPFATLQQQKKTVFFYYFFYISSCNSLSFKRAPPAARMRTALHRVNGKILHARLTGFSRSLLFNLSLSTSTYVTLSRVLKSIRLSLCLSLIMM